MIIFFGPAGAGKSVQGQFLAARQGWRWLSAGQLLRDTKDESILNVQKQGDLVDTSKVNSVISDALNRVTDVNQVVLDGFPRVLDQAKWLIEKQADHGHQIGLIVVIDVDQAELIKRLSLRGRIDDTAEAIVDRLEIYDQEISPILEYFANQGVDIVRVDGSGTPGQVHDRIINELILRKLV